MTRIWMAAAIGAALLGSTGLATAQARAPGEFFDPAREAPPLTVRKRPFTDSGVVVPRGYEQHYVEDQTTLHRPVYSSFNPDRYGQQILPRPFDGLGLY